MNEHLEQIRSEGYFAGEHDAPRDYNPYSKGSGEHYHWDQGWLDADADWRNSFPDHGGDFVEIVASLIVLAIIAVPCVVIWKFVSWLFTYL